MEHEQALLNLRSGIGAKITEYEKMQKRTEEQEVELQDFKRR